jgi:hypothetical protein
MHQHHGREHTPRPRPITPIARTDEGRRARETEEPVRRTFGDQRVQPKDEQNCPPLHTFSNNLRRISLATHARTRGHYFSVGGLTPPISDHPHEKDYSNILPSSSLAVDHRRQVRCRQLPVEQVAMFYSTSTPSHGQCSSESKQLFISQ